MRKMFVMEEKVAKRESNTKKIIYPLVFVFLTISILLLTIGFSAYSTSLAIDGKALVRPLKESRITDVKIYKTTNNGVVSYIDYTAYNLVSDITLNNKNSTVTYDITITNLSSDNLIITKVENQVYSNSNIEYVFDNMEINKTKINPASQYTFKITFKYKTNNITNKDLKCILMFTYKKVPEYTLKVKSLDDSDIKLIATGNEYTSKSSIEHVFDENTKVKLIVSKDGYYTEELNILMNNDISREIELKERNKYALVVNPIPSDSVVTIYKGSEVLKTGIGTQKVLVYDEDEITYNVSKYDYKEINENIKVTKDENLTINLNKNEENTIVEIQ